MTATVVHKPWGTYAVLHKSEGRLVKILTVLPHAKLSLQSHQHRAERWTVLSGQATVVLTDETLLLKESESIFIPKGAKHRLMNSADQPLQVLESSFGNIISEEDIVRYEDIYNR